MKLLVGDSAVIDLHDDAPEEAWRWGRELPPAPAERPADVVWRVPSKGGPAVRREPGGRWLCSGTGHHLLAMVQDVLVHRGATLLHACGLELAGRGVVLVGPTGAGKTLASLAALSDARLALLSDDLVVATSGGLVHAFPTPVAVRSFHRGLLPPETAQRLRGPARQSALLRRVVRLPGARPAGRAVRRRLAARRDDVGAWSRLVKTDFLAVPTGELFPADRRRTTTTAELVVLLDTAGPVADVAAAVLDATYANEDLAGAIDRYAAAGLVDGPAHHAAARSVVTGFLSSAPQLATVAVPTADDPADAQRRLIAALFATLD